MEPERSCWDTQASVLPQEGPKVTVLRCSSLGATTSLWGDGGSTTLWVLSRVLIAVWNWGLRSRGGWQWRWWRERGKVHPWYFWRVCCCVLSTQAFPAYWAGVMLEKTNRIVLSITINHLSTPGFKKQLINIYCKQNVFHTCSSQGTMQSLWNLWLHGSCLTFSPTL